MDGDIFVKTIRVGEQATNCYVVWSGSAHQGFVIDPGDEGDEISQVLLAEHIALQGILLTHGHFDHLMAVLELQLNFPAPVFLQPEDHFLLDRAQSTAEHFLGRPADPVPPLFEPLADGQTFAIGSAHLRVMHTPGHTPGSCCFLTYPKNGQIYHEQEEYSNTPFLFTGDTLFAYGIEPLTHRYSRPMALHQSLDKLSLLEEHTLILPGHGDTARLSEVLGKRKTSRLN